MKRLSFVLAFLIIGWFAFAQNNDAEVASLKKQIEKSDKLIQDPEKSKDFKVWAKRAKIMLDAYEVNIRYIAPGTPTNIIPLLGIEEGQPYYGKPKEIKTEGDKELWVYDKVTFIVKDGVVQGWIITKPVTDEPLLKAYEAIKKAAELDPKGKYLEKGSTKKLIAKVRDYLRNQAIQYYNEGDYEKAFEYLTKSIDLAKYPRAKDDTADLEEGALEYYAGVFAYRAGKYEDAVKYLKIAIDKGYEIGNSYQLVADALMKLGKEQEAVKFLEEGAKKYPTESKIIFALIDYYKPHGEYEKAFVYLDKAIELNPDMAILYLVKADAYNQIFDDLSEKYYKLLDKSDSLRKAAFRHRFEKEIHDKLMAEKEKVDQEAAKVQDEMNKYFELAVEWFNKGIEKDPKNPDAYYSLGALYYNRGMAIFKRAQKLPLSQKEEYDKLMKEYERYLQLARQQFEKAYELNPEDVQTMQNLAIIYRKLKMYDKANEMRQKIVEVRKKQQQQQFEQQRQQQQK